MRVRDGEPGAANAGRAADLPGSGTRTIAGIAALPRLRARSSCVAAVAVALALAFWGVGPAHAAAESTTSTAAPQPKHRKPVKPPAEWDEQLAPIAREVESIRGLTFEHPVAVEYLDDAAFRARLKEDDDAQSGSELADERRAEAQLRAVGLIAADVDLGDATEQFQADGVLAYYDPETERVTVRGEDLDPMTKSTLAHELTHALDDQHFDLDKLDRAADKANAGTTLGALIEGDAERVQQEYVDRLPEDERDEANSGEIGASDSIDRTAIPAAVEVFFGSPYLLGVQMVTLAAEDGGNGTVDELFGDPPRSELAFVDVGTVDDDEDPLVVPKPAVEAGEQQSGRRDSFGAFALYLMLSTAMDPVEALDAVRGWGGDAMVTVKRGDEVCVRANFTGRDGDASTKLTDALRRWSTNGAHPSSTVTTAGPVTTLVTCDGDAPSSDPRGPLLSAEVTVALRNDLLVEATQAGLSSAAAECAADGVIRSSAFTAVRDQQVETSGGTPSNDVLEPLQRAIGRIVADCRSSN